MGEAAFRSRQRDLKTPRSCSRLRNINLWFLSCSFTREDANKSSRNRRKSVIAVAVNVRIVDCDKIPSNVCVENGFGISKCDLSLHVSLKFCNLQRKRSCPSFGVAQWRE
jgi:hypothetical protein